MKKSPKLFMETYHKSVAGLDRRRSIINLQFMLEMREVEEDDESRFAEEFNVWLSDEPLVGIRKFLSNYDDLLRNRDWFFARNTLPKQSVEKRMIEQTYLKTAEK